MSIDVNFKVFWRVLLTVRRQFHRGGKPVPEDYIRDLNFIRISWKGKKNYEIKDFLFYRRLHKPIQVLTKKPAYFRPKQTCLKNHIKKEKEYLKQ